MEKANIIKAWKDPEYRASLTQEELNSLPEQPIGILDSGDLQKITGGVTPQPHTASRTQKFGCGMIWSLRNNYELKIKNYDYNLLTISEL